MNVPTPPRAGALLPVQPQHEKEPPKGDAKSAADKPGPTAPAFHNDRSRLLGILPGAQAAKEKETSPADDFNDKFGQLEPHQQRTLVAFMLKFSQMKPQEQHALSGFMEKFNQMSPEQQQALKSDPDLAFAAVLTMASDYVAAQQGQADQNHTAANFAAVYAMVKLFRPSQPAVDVAGPPA